MKLRISGLILFLFFILSGFLTFASEDWPMWRCDVNRSASTSCQLADNLYLQWQVNYSPRDPVWDDPLNRNLMQYDRVLEPVVAGNMVFIGFNDKDKVAALDISSGREIWRFYADGPVRLPLAVYKDKLLFTGDDGYCYCLNTGDGSVVWKKLLAPSENRLLGNKRLISMWPARGGIVVEDGVIYTAASIFPLMGTFIYALDAETGNIIWKNEGTGSNYILQPHNSPAFADIAPQGAFTISGDMLLVAGGRSVPAAFDKKSGEKIYYNLAASGKTGGAFTCANDKVFFNHHRWRETWMYDTETGERLTKDAGEYPVVDGNNIYFSGEKIEASVLNDDKKLDSLWTINVDASGDLIKAGNFLYAGGKRGITAVRIKNGRNPEIAWNYRSDMKIERLIAAGGKLVAVSENGEVMVFGDTPVEKISRYDKNKKEPLKGNLKARKIIDKTGVSEGYCLVFGGVNKKLLNGLLSGTNLNIVVYDKDIARVNSLRQYYDDAGIKTNRLSFLHYKDKFPAISKYMSGLTVVNDPFYIDYGDDDLLKQIFETTRPYGGKIVLNFRGSERNRIIEKFAGLNFYGSEIKREGMPVIVREGPLPGSSPWTHNYGDIANTVKSDDKLVRAPLGVLWFGGNSNLDVLPRHGHGPGEQIIDGRLIIQGVDCISARDVYTGQVLWKRESEQLKKDNWLVFYDETYDEDNPLDPKYNQVHLPGANARGTNFIATEEYVYVIEGDKCNLIDITNGEVVKTIDTGCGSTKELGYIGVYEDLLILGNNFADYNDGLENDSIRIKSPKFTEYNLSASGELVILNRYTGERLWNISANHGFIHNSVIVGDGVLFCMDKLPQYFETKLRRRGEPLPDGTRLLYLDVRTGEIIYEEKDDIFGTWLGYSAEYNLLLQATRPSRDMLNGEEGKRMIAYNVATKQKIWDKEMKYSNPPIIHNDKIYTNGEGFYLLTGDPLVETDPITGEELKWRFKREYGCGYVAASEYLLTFRSASAGFINLETFEGTGSLGGWKAGCSTNLIAADGVLNSPDFTRTCQCAYQNQTSLALINMPWMSYWTNSDYKWNGKPIKQLGLNFNAPGDRSSDDNTLWFEFPYVSGAPPEIPITIDSIGVEKIRKEPLSVISEKTHWVSSSALINVNKIEIGLAEEKQTPESFYTVKLYFSELENKKAGERVFDIKIQGELVAKDVDIAGEAGKPDKEIIKPFYGIKAGSKMEIELIPRLGKSLICGVELIQEDLSIK